MQNIQHSVWLRVSSQEIIDIIILIVFIHLHLADWQN